MAESPPIKYVAYPRDHWFTSYGTPEKLQALAEGYQGLNKIALTNTVIFFLGIGPAILFGAVGIIVFLVVLCLVVNGTSYEYNVKIAKGMGWHESRGSQISILMGLTASIFCGVVGYLAMEHILRNEMKRYGVRSGLRSIKKPDIEAALEQRRMASEPPTFFVEP